MLTEIETARLQAQLKSLMHLLYILDAAGEGVLGKGAPAMMYQAGRDEGIIQGVTAGRTIDIEEALSMVLSGGNDVWRVERWKEPGRDDFWMKDGNVRSTWLIFRMCPLLELSKRAGSNLGGLLCQALHGYTAGSMESVMGCRVEMRVGHCGPGACKVLLEMSD